jgi:phenylpropionate dioxygenase-like ring-hydroxylating dioxygenase large terminal subunit
MNAKVDVPHRWALANPDLGTDPVPIEPCCSPAYYERERAQIFKRTWLMVGRAEDVPSPGDYFVHDLPVGDTSLLIVRGKDGTIRAFHNMCSHRGVKLVWKEKGKCSGFFVCPFHCWSYDTSGQLRKVSDEGNFFGIDKSKLGLTPVACETWGEFIFVNLDPHPKETLLQYLAGFAVQLQGFPFEKMRQIYGYTVVEKVNWKVLLDAQNEVYHVPYLHTSTFPDFFAVNDANSVRNLDFRRYGRHCVYASGLNTSHKVTPLESFAGQMDPNLVGSTPTMIGAFDFYVLFPNVVLAFFGNSIINYRLWPLAVDRTLWEIRMYAQPPKNAGEVLARTQLNAAVRDTLQEDGGSHERIQAMLNSGAKKYFQLQDEEVQIRFFHKMVDDHVHGRYA